MPADWLLYSLMGVARRLVRRFPVLRRVQRLHWRATARAVPTLYGVPAPADQAAIERRLPPRVRAILQQMNDAAAGGQR